MILDNSRKIQEKIRCMFDNETGRRVIVVAYVGADAIEYLPNPEGIELYCSTVIPGTNPAALRILKDEGIALRAVDNLHSKIYWTENEGVVIASANLSNNGLSGSGNHEVGVFLESQEFDVQKYLDGNGLVGNKITYGKISQLERVFNQYCLKNKLKEKNGLRGRKQVPTYEEWAKSLEKSKDVNWRVWSWTEEADLPSDIQEELNITHPNIWNDYLSTDSKSLTECGDWILCFREKKGSRGWIKLSEFTWFIPELCLSADPSGSKGPFYWVAFTKEKELPKTMPFDCKDRVFRKAFEKLFNQKQDDSGFSWGTPSRKFLQALSDDVSNSR